MSKSETHACRSLAAGEPARVMDAVAVAITKQTAVRAASLAPREVAR